MGIILPIAFNYNIMGNLEISILTYAIVQDTIEIKI